MLRDFPVIGLEHPRELALIVVDDSQSVDDRCDFCEIFEDHLEATIDSVRGDGVASFDDALFNAVV